MAGKLVLFAAFIFLRISAFQCSFTNVTKCPLSQLQPQKAASKLVCAALCSKNPHCNLFHFNETQKVCYQGNTSLSGLLQWSDGPCTSYAEDSSICAGSEAAGAAALVEQLSLKLLYRFGTNGLVNLAAPGNNTLRASNVEVDCDGVHFAGRTDSHVVAATPDFENLIDYGRTYSLFVQVAEKMQALEMRRYLTFMDCDTSQESVEFGRNSQSLSGTGSSIDNDLLFNWNSPPVLPINFTKDVLVSFGVAFNRSEHLGVYFNGSDHGKPPAAATFASVTPSSYRCLMLGAHPTSNVKSLQGSMSCFALSTRVLTRDEFRLVENWCLQLAEISRRK